jgi:hypothetical protein
MEQALVEWTNGTTAWVGIHDLSSAAQDYVRARMQDELGVLEEEDQKSESSRRKRQRKQILSQDATYKARAKGKEKRSKRQKKKEAEELDAKISMPTCVCLSCSQMCRRDVGQC